jgi:hypothetical protein
MLVPQWKAAPTSTSLPLKQVSPNRLHLDVLTRWGATEIRLLGPDYLGYVDFTVLDTLRQRSSPALTRLGAPYVRQLTDFGWVFRVPYKRHTTTTSSRNKYYTSNGFPVGKSTGDSSRWCVDCIVNQASSAPTDTTFTHIEDVHDLFLDFQGGREDDARSFYGQFALHRKLWRLFAMTAGAILLLLVVMPQGWGPATRIAQQSLNIMYQTAYSTYVNACAPRYYYTGYVDNALTLSDSPADDAILLDAARRAHQDCNADFVYGEYTTAVTFTGYVMTTTPTGDKTIHLKASWAAKAQPFLLAVATHTSTTLEYKRQAVGVSIWACRVLRHALAEINDLIEWTRTTSTDLNVDICNALRRVVYWLSGTRKLMTLSQINHITIVAVDATPSSLAAIMYAPIGPVQFATRLRHDRGNPIADAATDVFNEAKRTLRYGVVSGITLPFRRCINDTELLAIYLAILVSPTQGVLLVCTDSMVAKAHTRRGLAPTLATSALVRRIATTTRAKQLRLLLLHVPSKLNPSDKYTRELRHVQGVVQDDSIQHVTITDESRIQVPTWV